MKKIIAMLLAAVMVCSLGVCAFADDAAESVTVYVNIGVEGTFAMSEDELIMAFVPVVAQDVNDNGYVDIDDVLTIVHAVCCPDGYESAMGDWGLAITKLWNDESGAFGYYLNNAPAWGLEDPVFEGSILTAFVYADQETWTDEYFYCVPEFNGNEVTVTVCTVGYDEAWNPVELAVIGAEVFVVNENNEIVAEGLFTDDNGEVTFTLKDGWYLIAATSDEANVVPNCIAVVIGE